jgi:hypothetical protein
MRYVRGDESLLFEPVSGTVDATYDEDWLTDGRPNFPVRTTGNLSLTVTPGATLTGVDVIAIHHHAVKQAATITLSGSVSSTIPTAAWPPDDIPKNWFRKLTTPVSVSSLGLAVTGNTDPVIIGGLFAGKSRTLEEFLMLGRTVDPGQPFRWEGEYGTVPPYDSGNGPQRRMTGQAYLTDAGLDDVEAWYLSTRSGTIPTLIIPEDDVNDAWLVTFHYTAQDFANAERPNARYSVNFEFAEIPRVRW